MEAEKLMIRSESTKISNIEEMLNTLFLGCDIRSVRELERKVQQPVIMDAKNGGYIKLEPRGDGTFQYRITQKGKNHRDNKL